MKLFTRYRAAVSTFVVVVVLLVVNIVGQSSPESTRKILSRVAPQYPSLARSMSLEGSVKADVLVLPNGSVKSVEIKGGHPLLGQAAQSALREWKWEPASHETHEQIELRFAH
jgi:TonB family protein